MSGTNREQEKRATIYDVASVAGVSHMTVSRVLNGHPNIRESTRERVLSAIAELGYRPSSVARTLATSRAMTIGVIVDRPEQFGPRSTLLALEGAAREAGYTIRAHSILGDLGERDATAAIAEFESAGVDAVCVIARRYAVLDQLDAVGSELPTVVAADIGDTGRSVRSVAIDQSEGARKAVEHLTRMGHRRVLHLSGSQESVDGWKRAQTWRQVMREVGVESPELVVGDWTSQCGYDLGRRVDLPRATAIFAANDQMALGLLHGLSTRGVRVPDEVSVIGYDDQPESAHFSPPLTTVKQDFPALGAALMAGLLEAIADPSSATSTLLPAQLVVRESVAPAS